MDKENKTINISSVTILKIVFIVLLLWMLWVVRDVLLILLIAIIISSAMDPLASFLSKHKIPRGLSVLLVYITVIGLLVLVGTLLAPVIGQQFTEIKNADVYQSFISRIGAYRETLSHSSIGQAINNSLQNFSQNFGSTIFNTTKGVVTGFVSVITILFVSFYLTAEENGMKNFIKHLVPYKHQAYITKLVSQVQRKMGAWVLGQFILSTIIFGLVFLGLTILHVRYALVLAVVAGVFEIIPILGPIFSGTVACFFAFLQSPALAIAVLIMWVIAQQLESNVIVPVVMSRSVGLNPVLVILGILIGTTLGGFVGALISIPLMSGISVFVVDVMEGRLEDEKG